MAERVSAVQVDEWEWFERRYGPLLIHERIDIGLASIAQMLSQSGKPLSDFLPTWWAWLDEAADGEEVDEAGMMIATMRAMAQGWKKRGEGASDGAGTGGGSGGSDNSGRYPAAGRTRPGSGSD